MHAHSHLEGPAGGHTHAGRHGGLLQLAVVATLALVATELVAGFFGHSISLVSDAVHNLMDVPALVISWLAVRWAERPPTEEKTYGYHRAGILAAFVNSLLTGLVAVFILYESYERFRHPAAVAAGVMLWVSLAALAVNGTITLGLVSGRRDLNLRAVIVHSAGDALSSIAIFAGALAIRYAGAGWVDPAIGVAIGAMVLWSGSGILRESTHILLEGRPREMRLEDAARALLRIDGVQEVHDMHIWTLGTNLRALSCHIRIPDMHMEESEKILRQVKEVLAHDFHITHTTIQFERAGLPPQSQLFMPEPAQTREE
ncbi:MAG: cation diffusion facilitator family transporter [Candidatus Acidiferrales bacterium]